MDLGEECDNDILGDASCESLGYYGGVLSCNLNCKYDVSDCQTYGTCGDEVIQTESGEECDSTDLEGMDCETLGNYNGFSLYGMGILTCGMDCKFDISGCEYCGDGEIQAGFGEECDSMNLGGIDCETLGSYNGFSPFLVYTQFENKRS